MRTLFYDLYRRKGRVSGPAVRERGPAALRYTVPVVQPVCTDAHRKASGKSLAWNALKQFH